MKKILVIGAGTYQVPAIKRISQLGYEVFCVDYKEKQIGFSFANGYRIIDVKDKLACLNYARELHIDGVLTWGATLTLPTVSFIGKYLNLNTISSEAAELSLSKYLIRKRLTSSGLNSKGDCFELHSKSEIKNYNFRIPFVVKPSDGSGSKGVRLVFDEADIDESIEYAFNASRNGKIYVEPYIKGKEFTVEAYAYNDDIYIYSIIDTEFYWQGDFPVYSQTTYLGLTLEQEKIIEEEIKKAVRALHVNIGPVNFDIIYSTEDNKPYIIDVGIRNGQNLIASHIIPYSRGVDELDNNINYCLNIKKNTSPLFKKYVSSRLLIYKPGYIKEIKSFAHLLGTNQIIDIVMKKKQGDILSKYETKADICGWVLTQGNTPEEAKNSADAAWKILKDYIIIE